MAVVSSKYLEVLDKWMYAGYTSLDGMAMTVKQKLRTQIVMEAYGVWQMNKQINPMDLCRKVSARVYSELWRMAETNAQVKEFMEACKVRPGVQRTVKELYNDVEALNHVIATFTAPTADIEKAKVVDASDWLIQHGMQVGDGRDVKSGAEIKMRLHKDFDAKEAGYEDMANADINITGDVSVVKPGRVNYTEEEKKKFAKRFGITEREVVNLIEGADGSWEVENENENENENN